MRTILAEIGEGERVSLIRPMFPVNSVIGGRGDACVALSLLIQLVV